MRAITASGMVPSATAGRIRCDNRGAKRAAVVGHQAVDQHETGDWFDVVRDIDASADRRQAQRHGKQQDQQDSPPEDRHRIAGQGQSHHGIIGRAPTSQRGDDTRRHAQQHRQQHRTDRQLDRGGEIRQEFAHHAVMRGQRAAQITVQRTPDIESVLHDQRPIQAELRAQRGHLRGITLRSPNISSTGSPGIRWISVKAKTVIPKNVTRTRPSRRARNKTTRERNSVRDGEGLVQLDHVLDCHGVETFAMFG